MEPAPPVPSAIAGLRIVCVAMMLGLVLFGGVVAFFGFQGELPFADLETPVLSLVAAALAVASWGLAFAVRAWLWRRGRAAADAASRVHAYRSGVLAFFACCEGGVLLNAMVPLLVAAPWTNVGVAAGGLAMMVSALPSADQCARVMA